MNENVPFEERKWTEEKEIERRKWELERTRNEAERAHDKSNAFHTYVNEATIEASNLALRTLVLINGGAAVAILAFLGAVASKDKVDFDQVGRVAGTLRFYAIGVACAVAAMAFAYLANFSWSPSKQRGIVSTNIRISGTTPNRAECGDSIASPTSFPFFLG